MLRTAAALMLVRHQGESASTGAHHTSSVPRVLLAGVGVGVVTGFLGVDGGEHPAQRLRRVFAGFVMLVALFMIMANSHVLP
jgi:hypothetical protein